MFELFYRDDELPLKLSIKTCCYIVFPFITKPDFSLQKLYSETTLRNINKYDRYTNNC